MELLLTAGALFVGYGYSKSAEAMKDLDSRKVKENYVPRFKKSVNRRTGGYTPYTANETEWAWDDHASDTSFFQQPKPVQFLSPDPGYQRRPYEFVDQPERLNANFYRDLQHFTNESWDTWDGVMALKNPNESYRGEFSELGNTRAYVPPRHARQAFAKPH
jgi:hypothetical protein